MRVLNIINIIGLLLATASVTTSMASGKQQNVLEGIRSVGDDVDFNHFVEVFMGNVTSGLTVVNVFDRIKSLTDCDAKSIYYFSRANQTKFYFNATAQPQCAAQLGALGAESLQQCGLEALSHYASITTKPENASSWQFAIRGNEENGSDSSEGEKQKLRRGILLARPSATNAWGTVCDDFFTHAEALVACRSMGFNISKARAEFSTASSTTSSMPIYMDDVQCSAFPNAESIADCKYSYSTEFVSGGNCAHYEDVAVDCRGPPPTDPSQWQLRLAQTEIGVGRLEMRPDNASDWGTVCDDGFDARSALAACRMLGYTNISHAYVMQYFGGGSGTIYLDEVKCPKNASHFSECSYEFSTAEEKWTDCSHWEDVGVDCRGIIPTNDAPVIGFMAVLNATTQSIPDTMQRIANYFNVNIDRVWAYDNTPIGENGYTTVSFRFLDPPLERWKTDLARDRLDYYLLNIDRRGVPRALGIDSLSSNATRDQRPTTWEVTITGSSPYAGLLTVRPNASAPWGTVCDDLFDASAAVAACISAGHTNTTRATLATAYSATHNTGSGPIYMDSVACPPNATSLPYNCTYIYSTANEINSDCTHSEDVTINCFPDGDQPDYLPPKESWEFKLETAGSNDRIGLFVVRPSSVSPWGTVCDDHFTRTEALAACRSLGFNVTKARARRYSGSSATRYANAPTYIDDTYCPTEASVASIAECEFTYSTEFAKRHNCGHAEDVELDCSGPPATDPSQWELRLTGGEEPAIGLLEMRPDNSSAWGTVCDDGFDNKAALAACHSLGHTNIPFAFLIRGGASGNGTIYLDNVNCSGGADRLQDCQYDFSTELNVWTDCSHWEDVSLDCRGIVPTNDKPIIGFVGTFNASEQSAQETMDRIASYLWIDVDRLWIFETSAPDSNNMVTVGFRFTDPAIDKWYTDTPRDELDYSLIVINRRYVPSYFGLYELTSNSTADFKPTTWDFTITGSSPYAGLLTVRPNASAPWGTVCDDLFDLTTALVACKSIFGNNATRATIAIATSPNHNEGTGPIYMDDVTCPSDATNLMNCSYVYSTITEINSDCTHSEDVTINCFPDGNQPLYIPPKESWEYKIEGTDGSAAFGLFVVRPSSVSPWGTVCDDSFTNNEALFMCRMLGFTNITKAKALAYTGSNAYNNAPIYLDEVKCPTAPSSHQEGNKTSNVFDDCQYTYSTEFVKRHNCGHSEDVALDCRGPPATNVSEWKLRLIASQPGLGRLEIQPSENSAWGTVCDDGFDNKAALAACHSLGYTNITHAYFVPIGGGSGTIYLDNVNCSSDDYYLQDCQWDFSTEDQKWNDCSHYEDIGVDCRGIIPSNDAILIGFTAVINITQQSADVILQRLASSLSISVDRIWIFDQQPPAEGSDIATFQFRFLDPTIENWNTDVGRDILDTRLIAYDRASITRVFNIISLTNNRTAYQLQYDVRLSTTAFKNVGRVELRPANNATAEWGTMCADSRFNSLSALAVCHSLGFNVQWASVLTPTSHRAGTGPIYLSEVTCDEFSTFLGNCSYAMNTGRCGHSQDAWIRCGIDSEPKNLKFALSPSDSPSNDAGVLRVRLYDDGPWDHVCSYSISALRTFNAADAQLACRAMGFKTGSASVYRSPQTPSSATYGLANLNCPAGASNLSQCETFYDSKNMNSGFCLFGSPVSIDCNVDNTDLWQFRLAVEHATKPKRGRFEMRPSAANPWGTVCSDDFDDVAARYACKALGFPTDKAYAIKWYGQGNSTSPIYLDNVRCNAQSNDFTNCSFYYAPPDEKLHNCQHWEDVGIDCTGTGKLPQHPIGFTALTNGNGDAMIEQLADWFYVDTNRFIVENNVTNGTEPFRFITFVVSDINVTKQPFGVTRSIIEAGILNLPPDTRLKNMHIFRLINNASEAIKPTMEFRLFNPATDNSDGNSGNTKGRLEIRPDPYSAWGTVCGDGFNAAAATAACHSLGFSGGGHEINNEPYNDETLHIYLDNTECGDDSVYFQNCSFSLSTIERRTDNCMANENIALECIPGDTETTTTATTSAEESTTMMTSESEEEETTTISTILTSSSSFPSTTEEPATNTDTNVSTTTDSGDVSTTTDGGDVSTTNVPPTETESPSSPSSSTEETTIITSSSTDITQTSEASPTPTTATTTLAPETSTTAEVTSIVSSSTPMTSNVETSTTDMPTTTITTSITVITETTTAPTSAPPTTVTVTSTAATTTAPPTAAPTRAPSSPFTAHLKPSTTIEAFEAALIQHLGINAVCYHQIAHHDYTQQQQAGQAAPVKNVTVTFQFVDGKGDSRGEEACKEVPSSVMTRLMDSWANQHDSTAKAIGVDTMSAATEDDLKPWPPNPTSNGNSEEKDFLSNPMYLGIIGGAVGLLVIGGIIGIVIIRRKKAGVGAQSEDRYDEDYIAMNDYRQSAI